MCKGPATSAMAVKEVIGACVILMVDSVQVASRKCAAAVAKTEASLYGANPGAITW